MCPVSPRRDGGDGPPEQPRLYRQVCNHSRYEVMNREFYFTMDPRILNRRLLVDATYMTNQNYDIWLTLTYLKKMQQKRTENESIPPDDLIFSIAQFM